MKFKVALLQISSFGDDQGKNLAKGVQACREAKALGADLAVFPELWNIGAAPSPLDPEGRRRWTASAIDRKSNFFRTFAALAREQEMNIAVTYLEAHQPLPRNTVSILDRRGEAVLNYSKVFICDFGKDELQKPNLRADDIGCDVNCSPGETFDVCTLENAEGRVTVGAMICADREFPEAATQLMLHGAELVVVPNACTWDEIRTAGLKTRAFENLVGIAMTNYPGLNRGNSQAHSCLAWRAGQSVDALIAEAGEQEQILLATFDVDDIRAFRKTELWRMDYRKAWHRKH
ncbi:MAG TPA: carbon-nitrogen hydrolase family protein [Candidatus Acidoferrales bacterium]|nr:carbon-nitrogen hydrolase family protein [Candidatus Acidoferrales bacterium]